MNNGVHEGQGSTVSPCDSPQFRNLSFSLQSFRDRFLSTVVLPYQKLRLSQISVTSLEQQCCVFWREDTKEAVIIDPGGDIGRIESVLVREGLIVKKILLTHSHPDHSCGVAGLMEVLQGRQKFLPSLLASCSPMEVSMRSNYRWVLDERKRAGLPPVPDDGFRDCPEPDRDLDETAKIECCGVDFWVHSLPGHSAMCKAFYSPDLQVAFIGDVVFNNGKALAVEATGGCRLTLIDSIDWICRNWEDETLLFSGHGRPFRVGELKTWSITFLR